MGCIKPWILRKKRYACYHGNRNKNLKHEIKTFTRNNDKCVVYVNIEKQEVKRTYSLKVTTVLAYIYYMKQININNNKRVI